MFTKRIIVSSIITAFCAAATFAASPATRPANEAVAWANILKQPASWYGSTDAKRIADNVLLWQQQIGGWNKNIDMAKVLSDEEKASLTAAKTVNIATIDNDATYTQIEFLVRVFAATQDDRYRDAASAGIGYVLKAQYAESGGWPQFYPLTGGYPDRITYNDNAMLHAMQLMREVSTNEPEFSFLPPATVEQAKVSLDRAIQCLLKTQIVVDGKKTAWCAQHDEHTYAPAKGRAYELVSISGEESVGLIKFLMDIKQPTPEEIDAINAAVAWFEQVKITGKELKETDGNRTLIDNPNGPVMWARFYEIGTNRPIFVNRDGVIHYNFADLGPDRRNGYAWIRPWATQLLAKDYPAWKARVAADVH